MTTAQVGDYQEQQNSLFNQSLFKQSSTKMHRLGTVRRLDDGRCFVYAKAGAGGCAAGSIYQSEVPGANFDELVMYASDLPLVGEKSIYFTNGATAITLNMFQDGYCIVNKGTSAGHLYKVRSNPAAGTSAVTHVMLYDSVRVAGVANDEITLIKNPYDSIIIHDSPPVALPVGVAPIAVTASYYFWLQTGGIACVLTEGTLVIGNAAGCSATTDGAAAPVAADTTFPIGIVVEVGVTTEWSLIDLKIKN